MDKVKPRPGVGCSQFNYDWLRRREMGGNQKLGTQNKLMKGLYSNIMPCSTWDYNDSIEHSMPGGVFNLEFSPDGSLLVAACEKRSILMFDPLSRKMIHAVDNAHFDCVNCVRFLDSRVFATCSDDSTVALWDARNLRTRIRTLQGHSNWVKNIEFSQRDGLLVTSGFDGSIYTWDINSYTESGFLYKRVFHTNGLMRTRLNPDGSKMIICTTGGYLIIIHDLDLHTLREDLEGFKPNMYRLMQLSQTTIPVAANFTHLFSGKRKSNRIEFVTDFPDGDDAEVVSSLQVHPQGWCALSRNISNDENSEWTCAHDIQEPEPLPHASEEMPDAGGGTADDSDDDNEDNDWHREGAFVINSQSRARLVNPNLVDARSRTQRQRPRRTARMTTGGPWLRSTGTNVAGRATVHAGAFRGFPDQPVRESNIVVTSTDVWEALVAIREARSRRERSRMQERRVGGSGILMPDQEPQTRFRIVRMSSGLNLADPEPEEQPETAPEPDAEAEDPRSPERQEGGGEAGRAIALDMAGTNVASIIIRYHLNSNGEGSSGGQQPEPEREPFRGWNRPDQTAAAAAEPQAGPGTSGARTIVILGSNANRDRLRQRSSTSAPAHSSSPSTSTSTATPSTSRIKVPRNHRIHQNLPRLSHYIQEPNVGRGFIKELCFSSDGRLICSPFGYGVRLLTFSKECSELSACWPRPGPAIQLHELGTNVCHADIVVSTKFSPRHCLLVSGCLTGRIVWHQPIV